MDVYVMLTCPSPEQAITCFHLTELQNSHFQILKLSLKMLDDRGNTAVYLLYAYARIR